MVILIQPLGGFICYKQKNFKHLVSRKKNSKTGSSKKSLGTMMTGLIFFGDFVRSTGRDFDDALALSMGLRRVSGKVIGRVAGMSVVVVSWSKSLFSS